MAVEYGGNWYRSVMAAKMLMPWAPYITGVIVTHRHWTLAYFDFGIPQQHSEKSAIYCTWIHSSAVFKPRNLLQICNPRYYTYTAAQSEVHNGEGGRGDTPCFKLSLSILCTPVMYCAL